MSKVNAIRQTETVKTLLIIARYAADPRDRKAARKALAVPDKPEGKAA